MTFVSALLGHVLFFGVFALLIALRCPQARLIAGRRELTYPIALKCLASVGFSILVVGTSYIVATSDGVARLFVGATMGTMTGIAFLGAVEVFSTRITYDANSIYQSSIFSTTNELRFGNVIEVTYSGWWSQHLIRDTRGGVVRVSKFMGGAEELVEKAIAQMPKTE